MKQHWATFTTLQSTWQCFQISIGFPLFHLSISTTWFNILNQHWQKIRNILQLKVDKSSQIVHYKPLMFSKILYRKRGPPTAMVGALRFQEVTTNKANTHWLFSDPRHPCVNHGWGSDKKRAAQAVRWGFHRQGWTSKGWAMKKPWLFRVYRGLYYPVI